MDHPLDLDAESISENSVVLEVQEVAMDVEIANEEEVIEPMILVQQEQNPSQADHHHQHNIITAYLEQQQLTGSGVGDSSKDTEERKDNEESLSENDDEASTAVAPQSPIPISEGTSSYGRRREQKRTTAGGTSVHRPTEVKVNTKGSCFVCFKDVEGELKEENFAVLNQLYLYLRVSWKRIYRDFTHSTPKPKWNPLDKPQLKLILCEDCTALVDQVKALKKALEMTRKRLDSKIQTVVEKMESAENKNSSVGEEFWRKMELEEVEEEDESENLPVEVEVVKTLREKVITKVNSAKDKKGCFRATKLAAVCLPLPKPIPNRRPAATSTSVDKNCRICKEYFTTTAQLHSHLLHTHFLKENPGNKCPYCPKEYRTSILLKIHLTKEHKFGKFGFGPSLVQLKKNRGKQTTVIITEEGDQKASTASKRLQAADLEVYGSEDEDEGVEQEVMPSHPTPKGRGKRNATEAATVPAKQSAWKAKSDDLRFQLRREPPIVQRICQLNQNTECKFCRKPFLTVSGLKRHYEKHHQGEKGNVLLLHRADLRIENKMEFKCVVCLQSFPGEISLRHHEIICQMRECRACKKKFGSLERLKLHLGEEHFGINKAKSKRRLHLN